MLSFWMVSHVENLFMCSAAVSISSLENYLLRSFAHLKVGLSFSWCVVHLETGKYKSSHVIHCRQDCSGDQSSLGLHVSAGQCLWTWGPLTSSVDLALPWPPQCLLSAVLRPGLFLPDFPSYPLLSLGARPCLPTSDSSCLSFTGLAPTVDLLYI
jgi:hypothetical protein